MRLLGPKALSRSGTRLCFNGSLSGQSPRVRIAEYFETSAASKLESAAEQGRCRREAQEQPIGTGTMWRAGQNIGSAAGRNS
jgi:hypothetical protein